jgi:predicted RNA-binding protein with TRAM domain
MGGTERRGDRETWRHGDEYTRENIEMGRQGDGEMAIQDNEFQKN